MKDSLKAILFIIVALLLIMGACAIQLDAYNGDTSCFFVKCVKIKP